MATTGATPRADGKRTGSPPRQDDGTTTPQIPKVRIIDRVLAQDANNDLKVEHMEKQMKNLEDFACHTTTWMARAEEVINGNHKKALDEIEATTNRVNILEAVPNPPGLDNPPEDLVEKLKRIEELEANIGKLMADVQGTRGIAETVGNDLLTLTNRLDEYTKFQENLAKDNNQKIEKFILELARVEEDTRAIVDQYYEAAGSSTKYMQAAIRELQGKEARRTSAAKKDATDKGKDGDKDQDEGKGKDGAIHIGSEHDLGCHCTHVDDLDAAFKELKEDFFTHNVRINSVFDELNLVKERLAIGLQANERMRGLMAKLEESGGDLGLLG